MLFQEVQTALTAVSQHWVALTTVGGGVVTIIQFYTSIHKKLSIMVAQLGRVDAIASKLGTIEDSMSSMQRELSPNGGSSLKDRVNQSIREIQILNHKQMLLTNYYSSPVMKFDSAGSCVFINTCGMELLRLKPNEDYKNHGWLAFFRHPILNLRNEWEAAIDTGSSWRQEATVSGHPVLIDVQCMREGDMVLGWLGTFLPIVAVPIESTSVVKSQ